MEAVAIVSVAAAALTVVVLAAYLIALAVILRRIDGDMRTIVEALWRVADRAKPLGAAVEAVDLELGRLRGVRLGDRERPSEESE